jgi:hypothetical protein
VSIINGLAVSADEIFVDVIKVGYKIQASKFADEKAACHKKIRKESLQWWKH